MVPLNGLAVLLSDEGRPDTYVRQNMSHQKHDVEIKEIPRVGLGGSVANFADPAASLRLPA
jgi:hypothetical protein